ncbi:DUSP14 [Cordylochernes scorpioides]|uniref:DUSP14 n=1 Tax=Cordylochernes scorpioides TaxID=51811 RepID=A0ABY6K2V1_9ARAC|nr:DUSP14 [Cordylochernes scorpioides]
MSVCVQVTDSMHTDLSVYFDQVADKIEKVRQENGKSLVHCVVGASRSATLCLGTSSTLLLVVLVHLLPCYLWSWYIFYLVTCGLGTSSTLLLVILVHLLPCYLWSWYIFYLVTCGTGTSLSCYLWSWYIFYLVTCGLGTSSTLLLVVLVHLLPCYLWSWYIPLLLLVVLVHPSLVTCGLGTSSTLLLVVLVHPSLVTCGLGTSLSCYLWSWYIPLFLFVVLVHPSLVICGLGTSSTLLLVVLVHPSLVICGLGTSLSCYLWSWYIFYLVTCGTAYLMKYNKMTLREAYKFAKNIRPIICPNNGFFKQLIEYERSLYGKTTVEMVSVGDGFLIPDIYQENSKGFVWLKSIKGAIFGK